MEEEIERARSHIRQKYIKYHNEQEIAKRQYIKNNPLEMFFHKKIYSAALKAAKNGEESITLHGGGYTLYSNIEKSFDELVEIAKKYGLILRDTETNGLNRFEISGWTDK